MKFRPFHIFLFFLAIIASSLGYSQRVENAHFEQSGKQIIIYYDLTGAQQDQTFEINVLCSTDGGKTFGTPLKEVSGDVGPNIKVGNDKKIIWDVLAEREKLEGEISFEIQINTGNFGSFIDPRDGHIYKTVKIGNQVWMAENLKTTKYEDGTAIPLVTNNKVWPNLYSPGYCWYDNDEANYKDLYGALYNWYSVNKSNLCPTGWHVPDDAEWTTLENYLITNGYNYDGTTIGNKIAKSLASTYGWNYSQTTGTVGNTDYAAKRNSTGFTALPGGYRQYDGTFTSIGSFGFWWSVTETGAASAWQYSLRFSSSNGNKAETHRMYGFSVRCLKD
jgi:uncharacterized protein (TIGR02145 family)